MRARRAAFTLTELMVVIMVISILAGTVLFSMFSAVETARKARTKTQVTKLHDLLMTRWESYRTRPVRLLMTSSPGTSASPVTPTAQVRKNAKAMAGARLTALRDLMRMEMPDRKSDVLDNPVGYTFPYLDSQVPPQTQSATVTIQRPAISYQYLKRAGAVYTPDPTDPFKGQWTAASWTEEHEDAECLYMIMASMRDISSNGLDFVYEGEIGDLDGDGMSEILDAWGQPIAFIRWPAGFVAHPGPDFKTGYAPGDNYAVDSVDNIPSYTALQNFTVDDTTNLVVDEDRDPFDPLRRDNRAPIPMNSSVGTAEYYFNFKLYPLVCSSGPDELLDIVRFDVFDHDGDGSDDPGDTPDAFTNYHYNRNVPPAPQPNPGTASNPNPPPHFNAAWPQNDPYGVMPGSKKRLGEPFQESFGYVDNITNHGLGD